MYATVQLQLFLLWASSVFGCIPTVDPEEDIQQWLDELDRTSTLAAMVSEMTSPEPTSASSEAPTTTAETTTIGTTTTTTTNFCPIGWTLYATNGHCYRVSSTYMNFNNAEIECTGSNMVTINDENEHLFVYNLVSGATTPATLVRYWIGLRAPINSGTYTWRDGTVFDDITDYSNWEGGAPNLSTTCCARCVDIYLNWTSDPSLNGKWDDTGCTNSAYAVCEMIP